MNLFTGIVLYLLIWWTTLFAVLPWGVKRSDNPETGHDSGAPEKPMLKQKFIATSAIATLIWLLVYGLIKMQIISFHDISILMIQEDDAKW